MSLDVYLTFPGNGVPVPTERIFVRQGGATVEVTRGEWDELRPGREPVAVLTQTAEHRVYEANITHNLNRMASECELYEPLWRPDEHGFEHARQLIEPLRDGLARLNFDHDRLQEFNPENGWGDYDLLVRFTANYLAACEQWPDAEVSVWR